MKCRSAELKSSTYLNNCRAEPTVALLFPRCYLVQPIQGRTEVTWIFLGIFGVLPGTTYSRLDGGNLEFSGIFCGLEKRPVLLETPLGKARKLLQTRQL